MPVPSPHMPTHTVYSTGGEGMLAADRPVLPPMWQTTRNEGKRNRTDQAYCVGKENEGKLSKHNKTLNCYPEDRWVTSINDKAMQLAGLPCFRDPGLSLQTLFSFPSTNRRGYLKNGLLTEVRESMGANLWGHAGRDETKTPEAVHLPPGGMQRRFESTFPADERPVYPAT